MVPWLISIGLFWPLAALYLGGMQVEIEGGGGVRQILGLLATFLLYVAVWVLLRSLLGGLGPAVGGVLVPTAIAVLSLPLLARLGFLLLGVKVRRGEETPAHH